MKRRFGGIVAAFATFAFGVITFAPSAIAGDSINDGITADSEAVVSALEAAESNDASFDIPGGKCYLTSVVVPAEPVVKPPTTCVGLPGLAEYQGEGYRYNTTREPDGQGGYKLIVDAVAKSGYQIAAGAISHWEFDVPKDDNCAPKDIDGEVYFPSTVCHTPGQLEKVLVYTDYKLNSDASNGAVKIENGRTSGWPPDSYHFDLDIISDGAGGYKLRQQVSPKPGYEAKTKGGVYEVNLSSCGADVFRPIEFPSDPVFRESRCESPGELKMIWDLPSMTGVNWKYFADPRANTFTVRAEPWPGNYIPKGTKSSWTVTAPPGSVFACQYGGNVSYQTPEAPVLKKSSCGKEHTVSVPEDNYFARYETTREGNTVAVRAVQISGSYPFRPGDKTEWTFDVTPDVCPPLADFTRAGGKIPSISQPTCGNKPEVILPEVENGYWSVSDLPGGVKLVTATANEGAALAEGSIIACTFNADAFQVTPCDNDGEGGQEPDGDSSTQPSDPPVVTEDSPSPSVTPPPSTPSPSPSSTPEVSIDPIQSSGFPTPTARDPEPKASPSVTVEAKSAAPTPAESEEPKLTRLAQTGFSGKWLALGSIALIVIGGATYFTRRKIG